MDRTFVPALYLEEKFGDLKREYLFSTSDAICSSATLNFYSYFLFYSVCPSFSRVSDAMPSCYQSLFGYLLLDGRVIVLPLGITAG